MSQIIRRIKDGSKKLFAKLSPKSKPLEEPKLDNPEREDPLVYNKILRVVWMKNSVRKWMNRAKVRVAEKHKGDLDLGAQLNFLQLIQIKSAIRAKVVKKKEELEAAQNFNRKRRQSIQGGSVRSVVSVVKFRKSIGIWKESLKSVPKIESFSERMASLDETTKVAEEKSGSEAGIPEKVDSSEKKEPEITQDPQVNPDQVESKYQKEELTEKTPLPDISNKSLEKSELPNQNESQRFPKKAEESSAFLSEDTPKDSPDLNQDQKPEVKVETPQEKVARWRIELEESRNHLRSIRNLLSDALKDVEDVKPIYFAALEATEIPQKAIKWVRVIRYNPPPALQLAMQGICILKGIEPKVTWDRIFGKVIDVDYWEPSKKLLGSNFAQELNDMKKPGRLIPENLEEFRQYILDNPDFPNRGTIERAFPPCALLFDWMIKVYELGLITNVLAKSEDRIEDILRMEEAEKIKILNLRWDIKSIEDDLKLADIAEEEVSTKEKLKKIGESISVIVDK